MKRLILVRHAKSSWSDATLEDHDRPLNARGVDASVQVGKWLAEKGYTPDEVLSSTATRCRDTWDGIAPSLETAPEPRFERPLYLASAEEMMTALRGATGDNVMMLGHMPGIGRFARELRRDPPPAHESFDKYPTGAVTVLDFRIEDWSELQPAIGKFEAYVVPRDLAAEPA